MSENDRVLIAGLGNPDQKYEQTRHNAGFLALDFFAERNGLQFTSGKLQGLLCSTRISGKKVFLLKPQTFMNRSGESVQAVMQYFNISIANVLVVHDDLDIAPGRLKMASGGGAGGHNGIRSLIQHLGTKDFARLKIGIGHPRDHTETEAVPVERFVLASFSPEHWDLFRKNLDRIEKGINGFVEGGILSAMNSVNRKTKDVM